MFLGNLLDHVSLLESMREEAAEASKAAEGAASAAAGTFPALPCAAQQGRGARECLVWLAADLRLRACACRAAQTWKQGKVMAEPREGMGIAPVRALPSR